MRNPLVSIIIPCYNRALLIEETLNSIIAQSYKNWECIIVDDDSTDNSYEVIKTFKENDARIKLYKRLASMPKGANACRNYGLKLSNGEYINWFDSDDIMHYQKIEKQVHLLNTTRFNFCVCQTVKFSKNISNTKGLLSQHIISINPLEDFITKKNIWLTQAPLFKRIFLTSNKFEFNERLQAGQEWEFFTRILFKCSEYGVINEPLVYLRKHQESISGNKSIGVIWHYSLARYFIFKEYNQKLSPYLKGYFLNYFKMMYCNFLRQREIEKANFLFSQIFKKSKNEITSKMYNYLILSKLSFTYLNKGEIFLRKLLDSKNFYNKQT